MLAQLWWSCCQGWSRRGGGSLFSWTVLWVGMGLSSLVRGDLGVCLATCGVVGSGLVHRVVASSDFGGRLAVTLGVVMSGLVPTSSGYWWSGVIWWTGW
jgi:hypothetical protein